MVLKMEQPVSRSLILQVIYFTLQQPAKNNIIWSLIGSLLSRIVHRKIRVQYQHTAGLLAVAEPK